MSFAPEHESLAKPQALLRVPVGLASPLWGLFAGAAMGGATWWWMTRWARPQNLEAMFGATAKVDVVVEPEVVVFDTPAIAPPDAVVEAAVAPAALQEAALELARGPILEVSAEPPIEAETAPAVETPADVTAEPEPVEPIVIAGGAADVALEAASAPKIKKKVAAPKAD
jgi:hypothetical protein